MTKLYSTFPEAANLLLNCPRRLDSPEVQAMGLTHTLSRFPFIEVREYYSPKDMVAKYWKLLDENRNELFMGLFLEELRVLINRQKDLRNELFSFEGRRTYKTVNEVTDVPNPSFETHRPRLVHIWDFSVVYYINTWGEEQALIFPEIVKIRHHHYGNVTTWHKWSVEPVIQ